MSFFSSDSEFWQQAWPLVGWTMLWFLASGTLVLIISAVLRVLLKHANSRLRYITSLAGFAVLAMLPILIAAYLATTLPRDMVRSSRPRFNEITNIVELKPNFEATNPIDLKNHPIVSREAKRVGDERSAEETTNLTNDTNKDFVVPGWDNRAMLNAIVAYLPWLWLVGTPLTFLLLATGLIGAERLRKSCQTLTDGPIRAACERLRTQLGIGRRVGIAICQTVSSPILIGVVKPLILLPPAALTGWTTDELEMVLLHELAHVRRWDNAVNLVQRIVESLLFFHPATWIMSNWVRRDREDCCDAIVVGQTAKPQAYAELLLGLASQSPGLATSVAMAQHPIASRIRRILKIEDEPMLISRKGLTLGVTIVLATVLLAFALPASEAEEQVSRESKRVADERSAEDLTTEDTESTEEKVLNSGRVPKSRTIAVDIPSQARTAEQLADIVESLRLQGIEGRIDKTIKPDGSSVNQLSVTVPSNSNPNIAWTVTWQESKNHLVLPKISFVDELERPIEASPETLSKEETTNPTNDTNKDLATEDTESTEEGQKERADSVEYSVVYSLGDNEAEIKEWLKAIDELADTVNVFSKDGKDMVVVTGSRKGHEKLVELLESKRSTTRNSLFPTLGQQRAADFAYKLLGVELEKLSEEDLDRAKAKGYGGGLKVAGPLVFGAKDRVTPLRAGDLLVGLHVWPTESLEDTTEILSRFDLPELSPLKFYVIRRNSNDQGMGGGGYAIQRPKQTEATDEIVTGRINVDLNAWAEKEGFKQDVLKESQSQINPGPARDPNLPVEPPRIQGDGDERLALTYADHVLPKSESELKEILEDVLQEIASKARQQLEASKEGDEEKVEQYFFELDQLRTLASQIESHLNKTDVLNNPVNNSQADEQTSLLYDGKTFEQWRDLWTTELKTERRVECIKALAAFGRAGKGQEASEVVLNVAAEFDFGNFEGGSAQDLKQAITKVLTGPEGIDGKYWLPQLIERLKSDPEKWSSFAEWVLDGAQGKEIAPYLKQIARDPSISDYARAGAIAGLASQKDIADDAESMTMVREVLTGDDPKMIPALISSLNFSRLELFPEQADFLIHKNDQIRNAAWGQFRRRFNPAQGVLFLELFLKVIDDPTRKQDHARAIEAIGLLNGYFSQNANIQKRQPEVVDKLTQLLIDGDVELLPATLLTRSKLAAGSAERVIRNLGDKISEERRQQLEEAAKKAEELEDQQNTGIGGMGSGGMGGGGGGGMF